MTLRRKRPIGITLIALPLLWIGCLGTPLFPVIVVQGDLWSVASSTIQRYLHAPILSSIIAALLLLAWFAAYALYAFLGVGLWRLRGWAWKGLVALQLVVVPLSLPMALTVGILLKELLFCFEIVFFSLIVTFFVLWYLNGPQVREAFGIGPPGRWMSLLRSPAWWQRSRRWVKITCGITAVCTVLAIFMTTLNVRIQDDFRQSGAYEIAVKSAQNSPCVLRKIGQPVTQQGLISGSLSTSGDEGSAELIIPVQGAKGKANLLLDAKMRDGSWTIASLIFDESGTRNQIVPAEGEAVCR